MRSRQQIWWWIGGFGLIAVIVGLLLAAEPKTDYLGTDQPRPTKGLAEASIVLEEFSDFQCPACKTAQASVKEVLSTFGDKVLLKYRHFPLVTIHTQAYRAALAAECANDQGKFWEYHDLLFDNQPNFSRDELVTYAQQLELNIEGSSGFAACLDSRAKTEIVRADMREGEDRKIGGTPTFYLNGELVSDWSKLKEIIQAKLIGG